MKQYKLQFDHPNVEYKVLQNGGEWYICATYRNNTYYLRTIQKYLSLPWDFKILHSKRYAWDIYSTTYWNQRQTAEKVLKKYQADKHPYTLGDGFYEFSFCESCNGWHVERNSYESQLDKDLTWRITRRCHKETITLLSNGAKYTRVGGRFETKEDAMQALQEAQYEAAKTKVQCG